MQSTLTQNVLTIHWRGTFIANVTVEVVTVVS
jgi:hypothetical protein